MDKISIIVPVYNMETRLNKCLDSLVNQTYSNLEIIVINDGSTDNSLEIINKYKAKYSNIVIINQKNQGISVARNNGIKKASGKYIGFVDSDDFVKCDMYEHLYKKITENDSDIVVCNYINEYTNKMLKSKINCQIGNIHKNSNMVYQMDYAPWNKMFKKSLWNSIKFPIGIKYEDLEAVLKVFLKAKKVCYLDEYLYYYHHNEKGETSTIGKNVFDIFKILNNLKTSFINESDDLKDAYEKLCIKKTFDYVFRILDKKDKKLCQEFYDYGYKFLNNNFSGWKRNLLSTSDSFKTKMINFIKIHPFLFKIYIRIK